MEIWKGATEDVVDLKEGVIPFDDVLNPREAVKVGGVLGELEIPLGPGSWRVRCRCEAEETGTGPASIATVDYDIIPRTDAPETFVSAGCPLLTSTYPVQHCSTCTLHFTHVPGMGLLLRLQVTSIAAPTWLQNRSN